MKRWLVWAPLLVLAALAVLFVGFGLRRDPRVIPDALVGQAAPLRTLEPLRGGPARAPGEPGRTVWVNYFASWCVPCVAEAPALKALQAQGVRIVGVAYKDDAAATLKFLEQRGDPYAVILADPAGAAGVDWGVSGVPETFVVAPNGRIVAKSSGGLTPAEADRLLAAAAQTERPGATPG